MKPSHNELAGQKKKTELETLIMLKITSCTLAALPALLICTGRLRADEAGVAAKLAKIPPAAAEALKKAAGTAVIKQIDIEKEGKVTTYEADLSEAGKPNREVAVTADGRIFSAEETIPLDSVPAAAKKAIETGANGAKIERVNRIKRATGEVTYEALYVKSGKKQEVEFFENGKQKPEETDGK